MKKALIVSTVSRQFTLFERGNIDVLKKLGYEVHCAANYSDATDSLNELDIVRHHIDIQRSPFSFKQIKALFQLKKIMNKQKFDLVHCHAPMGGVLGRICAKSTSTIPVIYTAHGFHFYKGAPFINNLVYKTIEKNLAKWTDVIITINEEDYNAALKFKCRDNGKIFKVPGVGIDLNEINKVELNRNVLKSQIGLAKDDFVLISIGELNNNKNHQAVIKAISLLKSKYNIKIKYIICGVGDKEQELLKLIENSKLNDSVHLLGYRRDIIELLNISDVFVFPSKREGLSKSVMEAMAVGLPIIASNIRGNVDLVKNNFNGYIFDIDNIGELSELIKKMYDDSAKKIEMGKNSKEKSENYSVDIVKSVAKEIYKAI